MNYIRSINFRPFPNDHFPFNFNWFDAFQSLEFTNNVTFIVGENGVGKSTIIEAIAIAYGFNPEGGSQHLQFETTASHTQLDHYITLIKNPIRKPRDGYFLRSESMYNLSSTLNKMGIETMINYGIDSLHEASHGEAFLKIFTNRFKSEGFYILDEPESGLSPQSQMAFLVHMHDLATKQNAQFIIATHSPIILAYPYAKIIEITQNDAYYTQYHDVSTIQLYKRILNDDAYIPSLFIDEE